MKADAGEIQAFVSELMELPWVKGTTRGNWPRSLFRVDDVRSAAKILDGGLIYSRTRAIELGMLKHDSAARSVIENSAPWIKDFARLYFRPKTPTEFKSEGFRPKSAIQMGAHRPMPIVLAFDSLPILMASGVQFTNGNASKGTVKHGSTAQFLRAIPFQKVYHEGSFKSADRDEIVFHRCAEVLVPGQLELTSLRHILCRSQAELETLIDLIEVSTFQKFAQRMGVSNNAHLKKWTFLETVDKSADQIVFRFSPMSETPEPFTIRVTLEDFTGQPRGQWTQDNYRANAPQIITIGGLGLDSYRVKLFLDEELAYSGTYFEPDSLF
jgi:hypothetical protein